MTVAELKLGQRARITGFTDDHIELLLNEMGFFLGEEIELANRAPLGDPICIKTEETLISIRKQDAITIHIKPNTL